MNKTFIRECVRILVHTHKVEEKILCERGKKALLRKMNYILCGVDKGDELLINDHVI